MRVCIVTMSFPRFAGDYAGGFVKALACGLAHRGLDVTVVCPHAPGYPRRQTFDGVDIRRYVYFLPTRLERLAYGQGILANLRTSHLAELQVPLFGAAGVAAVFEAAAGADIIHAHWTLSGTIAAPTVVLRRIPMLLTLMGSGIRSAPRWTNRIALRSAAAVCCSTAEMDAYLQTYDYGGPVYDLKHIPDLSRLHDDALLEDELATWCAEAEAVVTFVARMSPVKNPVGFVQAADEVLKRRPTTRFLVVGDGPIRPQVAAEVDRLGIGEAVRLTGSRSDVGALLRASTVFVANSVRSSCYSTTILEAMHVGVPAVVTDIGDPTGSYKRKDYVELSRPDDPSDLSRAIIRLLDDPELRARRTRMGRQFLVDFGFDRETALDRTIAVYEKLRGQPYCPPPALQSAFHQGRMVR